MFLKIFLKKKFKIGMFNPKNYAYYGKNVVISTDSIITVPKNVTFEGDNIVKSAIILSNSAKFIMKKYSFASYGLKVSTGNHARLVGYPCIKITQEMKPEGLSGDVIVEEDVWMGFNVTLLNGVIVRRGTTVASGAVVSKSTPPYCVVGGVPAKFIKFYWTIDQIIEHESKLYNPEERYTRKQLEFYYQQYQK